MTARSFPRRSSSKDVSASQVPMTSSPMRSYRGNPHASVPIPCRKGLLEREAPAGKRLDEELALDRRLDVEFLADVRILAD